MNSPFRVDVRAADRRLVRGYGPVVLALAAFLAMALLVPTIAPEQNVSSSSGANSGTGAEADGGGLGAIGTTGNGSGTSKVVTSKESAGSSAAGSATSTGNGGPSNTGGQAIGPATGPGAGGGATGQVSGCHGPQVTGDPYSPPCISFTGNNGGATYRGVTSKQIVVTYMNPTDGSVSEDQRIAAVLGHYTAGVFPETWADVETTLQNLVTYFNQRFQFYGRQIVLKIYNAQEDSAGSNQSQVNADALNVADSIKAFAEIDASSEAYQRALAAQRVVSIGDNYLTEGFYQSESPYAWGNAPDCTELGQELGAVATSELATHPVTFGGRGVANGQPRRFAVISSDNPDYRQCASLISSALSHAGHAPVTTIAYSSEASVAYATTAGVTQQIVNDKATTVLCLCDSIFQLLVSGDLSNANYLPEWFNAAMISEEADVIAQQMDQATWAHAALLTNEIAVPGKYGSTLGYFAAKAVNANAFVVNEVDVLYTALYQLALGIELAGPDLTPATFAAGLWSYQGGDGMYGPWSFNVNGVHYFTPIHQFRFQWWDPNLVSSYDGAKGSWVIEPNWYTSSDVPSGPPPVFPNGSQ